MSVVGQGPLQGFKVSPRSTAEIAKAAAGVRNLFGLAGPAFDAEGVLERLSNFGVTLDVVDDDDPDLPRGVEACWLPDTVTLVVRQSVYDGACAKEPRALFTVAHELGHLALGHRRAFNRGTGVVRVFEDSEWQANTFAGEFLMPLALIKQYRAFDTAKLASIFGVSTQAAETRLRKLQKNGDI